MIINSSGKIVRGGNFPLKTVEFKNTSKNQFGQMSVHAADLIASGIDFPTGIENATIGFVAQVQKRNGEVVFTSVCPVSLWISNGFYTFADSIYGACGSMNIGEASHLSNAKGSGVNSTNPKSAFIMYTFVNSSLTYDEEICTFSYFAIEA